MGSQAFEGQTATFLQWFKSLPGASFSEAIEIVDLRNRNAGRGIIANSDIPADTTLFTIPRKAIINSDTSSLREELPQLFESHGDQDDEQELDSWSALILIMMYEYLQRDQSQWKPYMDVLPTSFDTPMFWSDEEKSHLQASATVSKIGKESAEEMFRSRLLPAIRGNPEVFVSSGELSDDSLIELAHRMGSTIMAYAFDLENEEDEEQDEDDGWVEDREGKSMMGMVPMADILNADAEFNAHVNHGDDELTVTSLREIKAGEEILNYYGPHPNSELLRRYGYVTERHARYDVVEIPWAAVQDALVSQLGVSQDVMNGVMEKVDEDEMEDTFVLERESGEPNSDGTFAGPARVTGIPEDLKEQLKAVIKLLQKQDAALVPDKRKRDDLLQAVVVSALEAIAGKYPTNVMEDEMLLRRDGVPLRQRMAVEVRVGEKRLIQEALEHFSGKAAEGDEAEEGTAKRARTWRANKT